MALVSWRVMLIASLLQLDFTPGSGHSITSGPRKRPRDARPSPIHAAGVGSIFDAPQGGTMFIIWGKKRVTKSLGYVADFCPLCRDVRTFELVRVGLAGHIYYL